MDQEEVKKRAAELKARFSEGQILGRYPNDIEPGAIFAVKEDIFVGDFASNSLRKYSLATRELKQSLDLSQDGIGWSCGYDESSGKIYLVSSQKKELLFIDPQELRIIERIPVNVENGIFFSLNSQDYFIPGLSTPLSIKKLSNGTLSHSNIQLEPSSLSPDFIPFSFPYQDSIGFYYMDSRAIMLLKEGKCSIVHRFENLNGRLYRVQYLPQSQCFLVLTQQSQLNEMYSMIHMYDKDFRFIRSLNFPNFGAAGNFCVAQDYLFLTSRVQKYIAVFQYDSRVFSNTRIQNRED